MTANLPLPPQDIVAEEHVVGACMLSGGAIDRCAEEVGPEDFYRRSHGLMFRTMTRMRAEGNPVDPVTLRDRLDEEGLLGEVGGEDRVRELATLVPAASNAAHHARIVREASLLRGLTVVGAELDRLGRERGRPAVELIDQAERLVFDLSARNDRSEFASLADTVPVEWAKLQALYEGDGGDPDGLMTGFRDLDEMTEGGLQPGSLVVVAARPSMGKSALIAGVMANVALRQRRPVALFSLEMSKEEVTQRLQSIEAGIESGKLRTGRLDLDDWSRITEASGRLREAPVFIDDGRLVTIGEIRSKCRRLKSRHPGLAMVAIDYLQLMTPEGNVENRQQAIAQITRSLKILAGELALPVVVVSQLSRAPEKRHDRRPELADLRESGAIEQDADVVAFVYRDEYYHPEDTDQQGIAEVIFAKQRNGPTGTVKMSFVKRFARFGDLARSPTQPY